MSGLGIFLGHNFISIEILSLSDRRGFFFLYVKGSKQSPGISVACIPLICKYYKHAFLHWAIACTHLVLEWESNTDTHEQSQSEKQYPIYSHTT